MLKLVTLKKIGRRKLLIGFLIGYCVIGIASSIFFWWVIFGWNLSTHMSFGETASFILYAFALWPFHLLRFFGSTIG